MFVGVAVASAVPGCISHERGFDLPISVPEGYGVGGDAGETVPERWWAAFGDESLDRLQAEALEGNFTLRSFAERVRQARAVLKSERSLLFPTLDYSLFASEQRVDSNDFEAQNLFGASLITAYDADVWGRNRSLVRGARFAALVQEEELRAAAIALSADVALAYFGLVEQRAQAAILAEQIRTNEQVLEVVRARFGGGVVRASDVLRQERLLESTRAQRAAVEANIRVLEHTLLVLAGRPPMGDPGIDLDELPAVPPRPALGLPSELLRRRPDLRASLHAIEESDALIAAAIADRYPSVLLRAEAGTIEETLGDLFNDWFSIIQIDVMGPIFDGGQRAAEVRRAKSEKAERVLLYAQSALDAFREVLDAIANESSLERQIDLLERQLRLAARTSERLNREYLNGDISYIDVLDALTTEQALQRDLLAARRARIESRIGLYVALAGGWDGIVPPGGPGASAVAADERGAG